MRSHYYTPVKFRWAEFASPPPFAVGRPRRGTAAYKGYLHEARLAAKLAQNECAVHGPWIRYVRTDGRECMAQPDFLVFQPQRGRIVILEAKLRHCQDAFFQLQNLYAPLVRYLFPSWDVGLQEVVQWYDKFEPFPGQHTLRENLLDPPPYGIGVHILGG